MTGECKSARLIWHEATLDIESLVAKKATCPTHSEQMQELEPQMEALQRGEPVEVTSETGLQPRHWSLRKGHANRNQREKCPKQGYIDVLLDLSRRS